MAHYKKPYEKNSRTQKRLHDGEDAFKIRAPSSLRNYSGRKVRNENPNYSRSDCFTPHHEVHDFNTSWRSDVSRKEGGNRFFNSLHKIPNNSNHELRLQESRHAFNGGFHHNHAPAPNFEFGRGNVATNGNSKSSTADLDKHPVDLIISNLDSSIVVGDLKRLLTNMFKDFATISSLKVTNQVDGTACAHIKVSSQQEAQFAISQLHRQKLGQKKITISYAQNNGVFDPEHLKSIVVRILQEAPDKRMVLFKFLSLMQVKYQWNLSISEVSKLKDICKITEEQGCRIISLTEEVKTSPLSNLNQIILSYCSTHCPNGLQTGGWCEFDTVQLPNIMVSLNFFADKVYSLLDSHMNSLPLLSFQSCYEQTFNLPLPVSDEGIALEHLISCLPDIVIKSVEPNKNIKIIKKEEKKNNNEEESFLKGVPPVLASSISLLCRELVDFLRTMNKCQLPLSKFIPAYHHHFGRQCRVADYGFTKLIDLFESIPHVVQIIGHGTRRMITLSHPAQMRRFTSDLLKVLKVQPSKQLSLMDFPSAFMKIMNKPFSPLDYGLCTFQDLIAEIPESVIVVTKKGDVTIIDVPKKEQTAKEIAKTVEFKHEVVELLRHSPYCTLIFYEFIPAYHHHFGHQCKVSDYGFSKLIELFEAIPDVVKIVELPDDERAVSLTLPKMFHVLGCEILSMIKYFNVSAIFLTELPIFYLRKYGYLFKPQVYECENVVQVISNLSEYVQLIQTTPDPYIVPLDEDPLHVLQMRVWSLLLEPPYCTKISNFKYEYRAKYNSQITEENFNELGHILSISHSNNTDYVSLSNLYILAAQIYRVLYYHDGHVYYDNIEPQLQCFYKNPIKLEDYSILSANDLVRCFGFLLYLFGNAPNPVVSLNRKIIDYHIPIPKLLAEPTKDGHGENNQVECVSPLVRKFTPPKPDTPPSPGKTLFWNSPSGKFQFSDFSVRMPLFNTPKLEKKVLKDLISPDAHLFLPKSNKSLWYDSDSGEVFGKLTSKGSGTMSDDSTDSGVNSKLDISPPDIDYLGSSLSKNFEGASSLYSNFLNF